MKKVFSIITGLISFLTISNIALAYSGDIAIDKQDITFSNDNFTEGKSVRIYANVVNNSAQDLLGVVRYYDSNGQIGGDQVVSIFAKKTDGVFIDWQPPYGKQVVTVKIFPWIPAIDDPKNNDISTEIYVAQDTDHDGIPNDRDPDMDGDNVLNAQDAFPIDPKEWKDTDGDGIGDNSDPDIDNDGVPNKFDEMPLDANETLDTDHDGIGNIADTDDDNDGLLDTQEEKIGTNPLKADTDGDGVIDGKDAFPLDPKEWKDTDGDGIGNNSDTDIDNDGIPNTTDPFPTNKAPTIGINVNDSEISIPPQTLQTTTTKNSEINLPSASTTVSLFTPQIFDATPSTDQDGKVVSYKWEIDGKEVKEGNAINETFKTLGKHQIKLTITDNNGQSVSQNLEVSVLNIGLYKEIGLTLAAILLALGIYFKYIAVAKDRKDQENTQNKLNL
ncbi:MAG: thrombospondin type 3 repeat-containing protein [Candidatus Peregrinibacteria bacterium]|nr:thrombospondin type 3 repeat-containing protein [Candidatus Peregrinibacteria bacterium]